MEKHTAFIFPGQGSQYKGMADSLKEWAPAKPFFEEFMHQMGYDFTLMSDDELSVTQVTQPSLFTLSCIHYEYLKSLGHTPFITAGHSLGEYTALYAAGAFSFADGLSLVACRGRLMHEVSLENAGKMAAIIGLDLEKVCRICQDCSKDNEIVEAVNINAKNQIVISGNHQAVETACLKAKELGAKRAIVLQVSAPFHSSIMRNIRKDFVQKIEEISFHRPNIMVVQNVDGKIHQDPFRLKHNLVMQLYSPVRWVDCMEEMSIKGAQRFMECGPKKVLSSLAKSMGFEANSSEDMLNKQ